MVRRTDAGEATREDPLKSLSDVLRTRGFAEPIPEASRLRSPETLQGSPDLDELRSRRSQQRCSCPWLKAQADDRSTLLSGINLHVPVRTSNMHDAIGEDEIGTAIRNNRRLSLRFSSTVNPDARELLSERP